MVMIANLHVRGDLVRRALLATSAFGNGKGQQTFHLGDVAGLGADLGREYAPCQTRRCPTNCCATQSSLTLPGNFFQEAGGPMRGSQRDERAPSELRSR